MDLALANGHWGEPLPLYYSDAKGGPLLHPKRKQNLSVESEQKSDGGGGTNLNKILLHPRRRHSLDPIHHSSLGHAQTNKIKGTDLRNIDRKFDAYATRMFFIVLCVGRLWAAAAGAGALELVRGTEDDDG